MWKWFLSGLLLVFIVVMAVSSQNGQTAPQGANFNVSTVSNDTLPLPDCVIDLDCGVNSTSKIRCYKDFVVRDVNTLRCAGGGSYNASCVNETSVEFLEWCRYGESCLPERGVCGPKGRTCFDKIQNNGEVGIDCGGPCKPCSQCGNDIKDKGEAGIDCGGPCRPCTVQCTSNLSCGLPHWGEPFCGEDGSIYRFYLTYECRLPGTYDSFCVHYKGTFMSEYCGPDNPCVNGVCNNTDDRSFFTVPPYICKQGEPCSTDGRIYTTCRGSKCFDVKTMYSEVPGVPGHKWWT